MSTRTTSAFVVWIRRIKGSFAATGKLACVYTARATLVPSTSTCNTARCSLSAATMITESSGMTLPLLPLCVHYQRHLRTQRSAMWIQRNTSFAACRWLLSIKLIFVEEWLRIDGSGRCLRAGCNAMHRAQHHQFRIALLQILAFKQIAQNRNVAESRKFVSNLSHPVVHEAGDHETLPVLQLKFRVGATGAERGNVKSGDRQSVREIQFTYFRYHAQMDVSVGHDHGSEPQPDSKFFKRDGNRGKTLARLDDGERELSTSQKAGFLAVYRDQVRFRKNLQKILLLQRLDHNPKVDVAAE